MSFSAVAGDFTLTHGGNYNESTPTESEGIDISHFYKPKNEQFYVSGRWVNKKQDTAILFTYDNGNYSSKFDRKKSLDLGVVHTMPIAKNTFVTFNGSYQFGGELDHRPCLDNNDNKFFCSNLGAIDPYNTLEQQAEQHENPYSVGIRLTYKF